MRGPGSMEWSSSRLDDELAAALDTRRIAAVVGEMGAAIAVFDPALRLRAWNHAAAALFKWGPDALGQPLRYREDDVLALQCALAGGTTHFSTIGKSRDGHELIVSAVMAPVWGADGTVVAAMSVTFDRTTEVSTARRARLQQRRQAVLLRLGRLAMLDGTDVDIVRAARALAERLLPAATLSVAMVDDGGGLRPVDVDVPLGHLGAELVDAVAKWTREGKATDHVIHAGVGEPSGRTSVFLVRADDGQSLGLVARTTAPTAWSAGDLQFLASIASYLGTHLGRRRMAAALRSRALYDDLTGLANRSHLIEVLGTALTEADADGPHVGLLFFDIDRFKEINDRFGHKGGDVVLLELAARLRESAGERDLVARLGGDEFVVLARDVTSPAQLLEIASGFMDALTSPFVVANRLLRVTASCGVALADGSLDEEEALRRADVAMYDAKRNGRAHVRSFSSELGRARTRELQIDALLRERASAGEFAVTYQPRMTLPGRRLGAIEARVHAPGVHGSDSGRFLQLADELGTSLAIVAEAVVEAVSTVFHALPPRSEIQAVVQVPADMLGEPIVAGSALDALASLGVAPERLTLQASGAGLGTDDASIHPSLVDAGVRFAVMDLGAETTALRGFFDPWAHEVLLAEELVARLGELEVARHLAEAAASVAINLGLAVIGDGVTAERQLMLLEAAGCTAAQGPLWGERMTADELAKWLVASTAN